MMSLDYQPDEDRQTKNRKLIMHTEKTVNMMVKCYETLHQ